MADNVTIKDANNANVQIAADDVGGVQHERVKLRWGADGSAVDVSATDPLPVTLTPHATGGLSAYHTVSAGGTGAASVKGSAGGLYGYHITSEATAIRYVKLYDKATSPTVGSDTPKLTLGIPAGGGATMSLPLGVAFTSGIGIAQTVNEADSDTNGVTAGDLTINLFYA